MSSLYVLGFSVLCDRLTVPSNILYKASQLQQPGHAAHSFQHGPASNNMISLTAPGSALPIQECSVSGLKSCYSRLCARFQLRLQCCSVHPAEKLCCKLQVWQKTLEKCSDTRVGSEMHE